MYKKSRNPIDRVASIELFIKSVANNFLQFVAPVNFNR